MSKLLALIVLSVMIISVFSDDDASDCIFDWESFYTPRDSDDIVVDYSGQKTTILEEGGRKYHYIVGPVTTKSEVGDAYDVYYNLQKFSDGNTKNILLEKQNACYFLQNVYPAYLLPIAGSHSDFPSEENRCPMQPGVTHLYTADDREELKAPSKLDEGKYFLNVIFLKDDKPAGGIRGNFTVLRD